MDFDKVYKNYDKFMKRFGFYKVEEIDKVLDLQGEEVIVDIGGGTGHIATHLSKKCKRIYVLDESEKMLSKVKVTDKVIPVVGDAFKIEIDEKIDVVLLTDVLHHIKEQEKLIDAIYDKLDENGKLLILDFNKAHYKAKIFSFLEQLLFGAVYYKSSGKVLKNFERKFSVTKFIDFKYYFILLGEKKWLRQ